MRAVTFLCDNAACYKNNVFSVILQFAAKLKGFCVHSIRNSETQRGKGSADGHFAVAMNHIKSL